MNLKVYNRLLDNISETYTSGRVRSFNAANIALVEPYWKIGQYIVEFEQDGKVKAEYGTNLLERLSKDLSFKFGKGFSLSNVKRFRQFYLVYPISATLSHQLQNSDNQINTISAKPSHLLRWSHYVELLKIESAIERSFYEKQIII